MEENNNAECDHENIGLSSLNIFKQILKVWRTLVILLTPLVLLPIPLVWTEKVRNFRHIDF